MARIPLRPEPAGSEFIDLPHPPDWDAVFDSRGPLELEIGAGAGGFAIGYTTQHPERRLVAFEWRKKYAREIAFRAQKHGLTNIRVIEGDAREQVPLLFGPDSLDVIHLQFPDPWWKRAHQKRAIVHGEFTSFLISRLRPGGIFELRTDVHDRAGEMLKRLEDAGLDNPLGRGTFHPRPDDDVPSTRERRYLASGEPVYRAHLVRPGLRSPLPTATSSVSEKLGP